MLDLSARRASLSSLPASSFPSVTQPLPLMSSFDLQFWIEPFTCCDAHFLDLIFSQVPCSVPDASIQVSVVCHSGVPSLQTISDLFYDPYFAILWLIWYLTSPPFPTDLAVFPHFAVFPFFPPPQLLPTVFPGTQLPLPALSSLAPVILSLQSLLILSYCFLFSAHQII